tara:strand:+ start:531 stop:704 length:174 start_codon:yes stop_codon:yes gene_type:complete
MKKREKNQIAKVLKKEQNQFMRIAMARLKGVYPFEPQRRAIASKMYMQYLKRKTNVN